MLWLAMKTMFHEKGRFLITLVGITFSTVLVLMQVGIYFGMMRNATAIIRHTDADIWVASKNIQNFDFANPFPEERINRVRAMPEVLRADKLILTWGFVKLSNGGLDQVQILGFNPDTGVGAPWDMVEGDPSVVKGGRYMIMDKTSEQRLGHLVPGSVWELSENRFKLMGLSDGIKSFTTSPIIFMSYDQAQNLGASFVKQDQASFIVAKLREKSDVNGVVEALRASMRDNDVFTKNGFIMKTVAYWTIQTGIGMGFFLTAALGLMVGGAIVGQTIYANTMEHLKEFGTLKALGARNEDIYGVIFSQAGINALMGYAVGVLFIVSAKGGIERAGVTLYISPLMLAAIFISIALTCLLAAFFSVRKIRTLDPVTVFRS